MLRWAKDQRAFTSIEMAVSLSIVVVILIVATFAQIEYLKKARRITLEHDLKLFAQFEITQYNATGRFAGSKGQVINYGELDSDFQLGGFRPSRDVTITIVSGEPQDPYNPERPFIVQAKHRKLSTTFVYNLTTSKMEEK